jgi:hypothetical protein
MGPLKSRPDVPPLSLLLLLLLVMPVEGASLTFDSFAVPFPSRSCR